MLIKLCVCMFTILSSVEPICCIKSSKVCGPEPYIFIFTGCISIFPKTENPNKTLDVLFLSSVNGIYLYIASVL